MRAPSLLAACLLIAGSGTGPAHAQQLADGVVVRQCERSLLTGLCKALLGLEEGFLAPVGVATDSGANLWITYDTGRRSALESLTPPPLQQIRFLALDAPTVDTNIRHLAFESDTNLLVELSNDGALRLWDVASGGSLVMPHLASLPLERDRVYDVETGSVRSFEGRITPGLVSWGDLDVVRRPGRLDVFATGFSPVANPELTPTPFVARLVVDGRDEVGGGFTPLGLRLRVLVASTGYFLRAAVLGACEIERECECKETDICRCQGRESVSARSRSRSECTWASARQQADTGAVASMAVEDNPPVEQPSRGSEAR